MNNEVENVKTSENLSEIELQQQKYESVMNAVNDMTAFYRSNPHRFAEDYLNIHLKLFQKIILYAMVHNNFIMYVASRGCLALLFRNKQVIKGANTVKAKFFNEYANIVLIQAN